MPCRAPLAQRRSRIVIAVIEHFRLIPAQGSCSLVKVLYLGAAVADADRDGTAGEAFPGSRA